MHTQSAIQKQQLQQASQYLSSIDADWAQLVQQIGPCNLQTKSERSPYEALVRAVAYQQLSTKVGDVIIGRFLTHFAGFPTPAQLISTEFDALRACGFSGRKIETMRGIAQATLDGLVPSLEAAASIPDEALINQLVTLKGIGRWTVEMMLIFTLERLDVLPVDDLGVREGYKRLKGLETAPKPKELMMIGSAWQPYRTVASWYLWRVPKTP
jgi:DNA-3-methyladenine glycosylase II